MTAKTATEFPQRVIDAADIFCDDDCQPEVTITRLPAAIWEIVAAHTCGIGETVVYA